MPATATFLTAANLIGSVVLELMVSRRNNLSSAKSKRTFGQRVLLQAQRFQHCPSFTTGHVMDTTNHIASFNFLFRKWRRKRRRKRCYITASIACMHTMRGE